MKKKKKKKKKKLGDAAPASAHVAAEVTTELPTGTVARPRQTRST
jgi:hypothetical protein